MKNISIIKSILFPVVVLLVLSSCVTQQKYERPAGIVEEKLFRTDLIPQDSLSFGNLSWKEIFTDPILQKHINKTLENNLDIRMALQNIISAEAYLKQSKAAYFPTINVGPNYTFNTQSLNTTSGQMLQERRYLDQFDVTGSLNWEIDVSGKLAAQQRAQLASYLGTVSAHQAVKSDW